MKRASIKRLMGGSIALAFGLLSQSVFAQYYPYPYLEAECPDTFTGSYGTTLTGAAGYSGPGHLQSQGNSSASTYDGMSEDYATYQFTVNHGGYFVVYFRVNTNGSGGDDSWFYRVDGEPWMTVNNVGGLGAGWHWVAGGSEFLFGAGGHMLEIANREDGLKIDKFAILPASAPAPSGLGEPAYNCPVPVYFEAECRDQALGAYQIDRTTKAGYAGTGYLESQTTSTNANSSTDSAIYHFESADDSYDLYFRVNTNGSGGDDSWFYRVDSGSWTTMNNVGSLGTGWHWVKGAAAVSLTRGVHTVEVRNREDGLSLDKIAFIPSSGAAPSGTGGPGVNCEPFTKITDWSFVETVEYVFTHLGYMTTFGNEMLEHHVHWHNVNGPGGLAGPGSGVAFLGFHRAMMNHFRQYALATGGRSWLPLDVYGHLPAAMSDAYQPLAAAGFLEAYSPRVSTDLTSIGIPGYLTVDGIGDARWGNNIFISGVVYDTLEDIPDLDMLGRIIARYYHASVHNTIGGTMAGYYSPADPAFYPWHGHLDRIVDVWLGTSAGQAWAAANPSHPFLENGFTSMEDGWDNADWAP